MTSLLKHLPTRGLHRWTLAVGACAALLPGLLEAAPRPATSAGTPSALRAACAADQQDRDAHDRQPQAAGWEAIGRRDRERQAMVLALLRAERLRTLEDHRCAALILLHAGEEDRLRLAFAVATQGALRFDPAPALTRLAARAWDRLMLARRQPQWYATQFEAQADGSFRAAPLLADVLSEQERVAAGGLSDAQAAAELQQLDARPRIVTTRPPVEARKKAIQVSDALIRRVIDVDPALAFVLMQWRRAGIALNPDAASDEINYFLARPSDMLRDMLDRPEAPWPRPPGSSTPTSAAAAVYRMQAGPEGPQLRVGLDDDVQAAAVMQPRPTRWYLLHVQPQGNGLDVLAWQPSTAPEAPLSRPGPTASPAPDATHPPDR